MSKDIRKKILESRTVKYAFLFVTNENIKVSLNAIKKRNRIFFIKNFYS
jgi:hypothetical protein